jgi:hypothetical protein
VGEIERRSKAKYYEVSFVGQFRAADKAKARRFAQYISDLMGTHGVHDVGYDVREMGEMVLNDDQARMKLINDTWRPEWGPKPWEREDRVPSDLFPESVPHSEVQKALGRGDGEQGTDN